MYVYGSTTTTRTVITTVIASRYDSVELWGTARLYHINVNILRDAR